MTAIELTVGEAASSPLSQFVSQILARRVEAQRMDWSPPPPPPDLPEFKSNRLRWDTPGAANQAGGNAITIEELREQLPQRMMQYLLDKKDKSILLVKVAAGGGKTYAGVQFVQKVARELRMRVMWAGGRHDMYDQIQLVPGFNHELWYHFQPMGAEYTDTKTGEICKLCRYAEQQNIWSAVKRYPAIDLCESLCGAGKDNHIKRCPYRLQAKQKEKIIYTMHQHLSSGMAIANYKLAIVDENPLGAFVGERVVSFEDLNLKDAGGPLSDLLGLLRLKVAQVIGMGSSKRISGKALLDEIGDTLDKTYDYIDINPAAIPVPPYIWSPELVTTVPAFFVMQMLDALVLEHAAWKANWNEWAERVWVEKDGLHILERGKVWQKLPEKVIVLDATANPAFYKQIFGREMTVYQPEIKRAGKLFQVVSRLNGKGSLTQRNGKVTQSANEALEVAKQIAEPYLNKQQRVSIICTKDVRQLFEREFGEQNVAHFYALRGTNEFADAACMIVVGAPSPDIRSVVNNAIALNEKRQKVYAPMDDEGKLVPLYHTAEREYRVTRAVLARNEGKAPYRALKGYWAEPDLQAVYDQMRESELVQALHRSRVNVRDTAVWLLTSVMTGEALDGIWDDPPAEAGFPEGMYWKQWLKIKTALASPDRASLTYEDVAEITGVQESYARQKKWLDAISIHLPEEWQISALERNGAKGGRPKKALRRTA